MILRATSFSTRQDLAEFCKRVTNGESPEQALQWGDNGIGEWNDPVWQLTIPPAIALPYGFGFHGSKYQVLIPGHPSFVATCLDRSPTGIVDLAPSALLVAGFGSDDDINIPGVLVTLVT